MKIVKEVLIRASKTDIWAWLSENKVFKSSSRPDGQSEESGSANRTRIHMRKSEFEPQSKVCWREGDNLSIITTLELHEQGKRTQLVVTISGWERIDSRTAKIEMPKISLAWEKRLGVIKKAIESSVQNPHR
jgi:hypothetical protein